MSRPFDSTIGRLEQAFRAVAAQVIDAPPALATMSGAPAPPPRRRRALLVAAATVVALVVGAVAFAFTRDSGSEHVPVIQQPSVSTTTPTTSALSMQHLVPGPGGSITRIDEGDASSLPTQPREYQLGYAGTVGGRAAQLLITADDFSDTASPTRSLGDQSCATEGTPTPQRPGSVVAIGNHQACLVTQIQDTIHVGWIDPDGVNVLLQGSGLSVKQMEAVAASVERVPGDPLALRLATSPPPGLDLIGDGLRPPIEEVSVSFDQGGCSYFVRTRRADPVPFGFNPYSVPATVRGVPGRVIGIGSITWTRDNTTWTLGIHAQDVRAVMDHCDSSAVAESLVPVDDNSWQRLLADHPELVHRNGG